MIKRQAKSYMINNSEHLTVVREDCVTFIDGKPIKKNLESFSIRCNVQPLDGRQLLLVPEGDRYKEQYWVFTESKILVNDRIVRCNVNFQVQEVRAWGSYFQCRIMRIDTGPNATNP